MRRASSTFGAAAAVAVMVAIACGSTAPQPSPRVTQPPSVDFSWEEVALPDGMEPTRLVVLAGELVVGAEAAELPNPRLLRLDSDGEWDEVPVEPLSYYGERAHWAGFAVDGTTLYALGSRAGGAHGNPRWSTWEGTLDGVAEQLPQPMETFGGGGAGGLVGITVVDGSPVIAGSRAGSEPGLDIEVWLPGDGEWIEQSSTGTALAATADVKPVPTGIVTSADGLVISGMTQRLEGGSAIVTAAVWTAPAAQGPWQRVDLPAAGAVTVADAVGCDDDGCLVVGHGDDGPLAWRLVGGEVDSVVLPTVDAGAVPLAPIVWQGSDLVAVRTDALSGMLVSEGEKWHLLSGPPGEPVSAAAVDEHVVTVAAERARLWVGSTG